MKITKKLLNETKMPDTPTARKVLAKMLEEDDDIQDYKKPWVNLTVDELIDLEHKHLSHENLVRAIEAKLREKNA